MSICGLFFCGTHMQLPFWFSLAIFTLKTFLLHAGYPKITKLYPFRYTQTYTHAYIYIYIYIYDNQLVQPTNQCFKSFNHVYFVNDC